MIRAAGLLVALTLLVFAAPARADFDCNFGPGFGEVFAEFEGGTTAGTLRVSGGNIQADGVDCGSATTANTNTIIVTGTAAYEILTIDLGGGDFAPGPDEGDGSSEIEFEINMGAQPSPFDELFHPDVIVLGHATNADHITAGFHDLGGGHVLNLNANEATGVDRDVDFAGNPLVDIDGRGGNDVIDAGGGEATGDDAGPQSYALHGRAGNDTITYGQHDTHGGANDDQLIAAHQSARLTYEEAAGPVTLELGQGTFGKTGTGLDGDGGTDTFLGFRPSTIALSPHADVLHGGPAGDNVDGLGGVDTMFGGDGFDWLVGGEGNDVLHGEGGGDSLDPNAGDDDAYGEAGPDTFHGSSGDDESFGGEGNDQFWDHTVDPFDPPSVTGADIFNGGAGFDEVKYGLPNNPFSIVGRTNPVVVDIDGVADDGEANENDNVMPDVESVWGGVANDTLTGSGAADTLHGFDGADRLRGGGGADALYGLGNLPFAQLGTLIADEGDDIDGEGGSDTVFADEGDDLIEARDGVGEAIDCGPGNDTGRADAADTQTACEGLALPAVVTPDPPADPEPTPPPPAPPAPLPPIVQPPVTPPAVTPTVAQLVSLPSSRRCASRRRFRVRVRSTIRGQVRRVTIFINGRRVRTVTGRRIGLPIDLRGLPKGRIRVRLRVELTDGRIATDTRTYRTCATKKRRGRLGRRRG
jgi:Ca2+-binding RTX toxin-like protein